MRLVAWNVNHRSGSKPIASGVAEAITALAPDVIVLTEYVAHDSHNSFFDQLAEYGLRHLLVSDFVPNNNRVLVASRYGLAQGSIRGPAFHESVPSNTLHVVLPTEGFDLLGLRMPDLTKHPKLRRAWWDWLEVTAAGVVDRPFAIAGDFNTDVSYPRAKCGDRPARLVASGWQHVAPPDGASYFTLNNEAKLIDHAFVTQHFVVKEARYVSESAGHRLIGKPAEALSDHTALVVDMERAV